MSYHAHEIYYDLSASYHLVDDKTAVQEDKDGNLGVILVLYSAADAKAAVHEDTDEFVLISATMFVMKPACRRGSMAPAASRSMAP